MRSERGRSGRVSKEVVLGHVRVERGRGGGDRKDGEEVGGWRLEEECVGA